MRAVAFAAALLASTPAFAVQVPQGVKADSRICDVNYDPNNVTEINSLVGNTVTIEFGAKERIQYVTPSDTAHLQYFPTPDSNVLWLKPSFDMPPQQLSVRTLLENGDPRLYTIQWSATDKPPVAVASNGPVSVTEDPVKACYLVRYHYPEQEKAEKVAAARARWAKEKRQAAEVALRKQAEAAAHNVQYVARGDASIGPSKIWDDGNTTTLVFPGNTRIPVILTVTPDGKESQVTGTTTEEGGVVKIHGTLPFIRLRDGGLTLCIWNLAYNPTGANPETGTTSSSVSRGVASQ